ncbi:phospholipase A1-like [Bradysia coprophila]|uniref:phospholipase A1-like n=1 Tax=Bradysia coprophila TaxID=38358 RepID=UPI00187DB61E|nr:phospholipase A1-like [Bradysia coprophila]
MNLSQLVVIGHSLGAHISGTIGRYIYANTNQKVDQIIALDPAMPLFSTFVTETDDCIHKSDAGWVTVIHTSPLGIRKRLGHIDLYPNGGWFQAGCEGGFVERIACSHSIANNILLDLIPG